MKPLRMLSLCSGIGGIDLAACWTGAIEIVGQVEVNPFRLAVLAKHFPAVPRMNDITKLRGDEFGPVDSVAGGIPCQPFSHAGKRHGTADDRHLWPFAFTIIQNVHPAWVLIENVAGFIDLALDLVATDLEREKYAVQAYVLPACAVGAPHQRARCFVVAYADSYRRRLRSHEPQRQPQRSGTPNSSINGPQESLAHADGGQCGRRAQFHDGWSQVPEERDVWPNPDRRRETLADSSSARFSSEWDRWNARTHHATSPCGQDVAHANSPRGSLPTPGQDTTEQVLGRNGESLPNTNSPRLPGSGKQRGLRAQTGETPAVLERGNSPQFVWGGQGTIESQLCRGHDGLSARLDRHRWPALPGVAQEDWEPPRTITEKILYRNQRLEALGDAVVPQQIYPLFYWIAILEGRIPA